MQKLLITVPVYNESLVLDANIRTLHTWCGSALTDFDWEIVIADNGSTDTTRDQAATLARELPQVRVFHTDERGRGQVLRRAWAATPADLYTYMDADLATDLGSYRTLVDTLARGEADVAIGSRLAAGSQVDRSAMRELTSVLYNQLARLVLGWPVRDAQCGSKGATREVIDSVLPKTRDPHWFWDTEFLAHAHADNFRIIELPVTWVETRTAGRKSKVSVVRTALGYMRSLAHLRWQLWRNRRRTPMP